MVAVALGAIAASSTAQTAALHSGGPFAGTALAFSRNDAKPDSNLLVHPVGFRDEAGPFVRPDDTRPSYALEDIFKASPPTRAVEVDAMSAGLDWVLARTNGEVFIPEGRWGFLTFSVQRGSRGLPGSRVRDEGEDRYSDAFNYVLEIRDQKNPTVPKELFVVERALDRSELGVGADPNIDVDAMDQHLSLWGLDTPALPQVTRGEPKFYFSLTAATAANVPKAWLWNPRRQEFTEPSGASVFFTTWRKDTGWDRPRVAVAYYELLGRAPAFKSYDLIALAYDGRNDNMLVSIVDERGRTHVDPLLFARYDTATETVLGVTPYTYDRRSREQDVSRKLGLDPDDRIDALCAGDPKVLPRPKRRQNPISFGTGTPVNRCSTPSKKPTFSASGFRALDRRRAHVKTFAVGWPRSCAAGWVALAVSDATRSCVDAKVDIVLPAMPRRPQNCRNGDPHEISIPVDSPVLAGRKLRLHWFALDSASSEIVEALPIDITLPGP